MRYFCLLLFIFLPSPVLAIEFSEIAYDIVGTDDGLEWVELHNETDQTLDLTNHYFNDGANHALVVPPGKGGQGSIVIAPGAYMILAADAAQFLATHANYAGSVIDTTMSLLNYSTSRSEPVELQLLDADKKLITQAQYLPTAKGAKGYTLELDANLVWVDSVLVNGSPGNVRPPPTTPPPIPPLKITEILSNPTGPDAGAEQIELYNAGDSSVSLAGWYITDQPTESGKFNRYSLAEQSELLSNNYLAVILKGSFLNNKDETVSLWTADDRLVDSVVITDGAKEGYAYAYSEGAWQWTSQPTLGGVNTIRTAKPVTVSSTRPSASGSKAKKEASPGREQSVTQRLTNSVTSPQEPKVTKHPKVTPSIVGLPTGLASVAGIEATEPPSKLLSYLTLLAPPSLMITAIAYYLYKKGYLPGRHKPPSQSITVVGER